MGGKKMFFSNLEKIALLSNASYYAESIELPSGIQGFCFNSDYSKIWVISNATSNTIRQYSLNVAGDISTMIYESSISLGTTGVRGILSNPNDLQIYVWDINYGMRLYDLSVMNDITSATINATNYYLDASAKYGFDISPDGKNMIIANNNLVMKWKLDSPFDFNSLNYEFNLDGLTTIRSAAYVNHGRDMLIASSLSGFQSIKQLKLGREYGKAPYASSTEIDFLDLSSYYGTGSVQSAQFNKNNDKLYFYRGGSRKIYQFNLA